MVVHCVFVNDEGVIYLSLLKLSAMLQCKPDESSQKPICSHLVSLMMRCMVLGKAHNKNSASEMPEYLVVRFV